MIIYKKCSEVDIDLVFKAFNNGFEDYIIKVQMSQEFFIKRFFGPEGNSLDLSFIALDEDKPIGVVLGGVKVYEGIKTMRCGTLAIQKEYRGLGISQQLMKLHKEEAVKQGCRQLFLEVIVGNDRAVNFYKRLNYEKIYDLSYYILDDISKIQKNSKINLSIKPMDTAGLKVIREKILDVHINWQNDVDYLEKSEEQLTLAACTEDRLAGVISMNKNGKINFLWVNNSFRNKGIAKELILEGSKILNLSKVTLGFPNNSSIQGFANHIGFTQDKIAQYEMYYTL